MNPPIQVPPRSFVPLLEWCEQNKIVPPGTTKHVNDLADNMKRLGNALRAAGVKKT